MKFLFFTSILVTIYCTILSLLNFDSTMQLIITIASFLKIIRSDFLTIWALFRTIWIVGLEILRSSLKYSFSVLYIIFKKTFKDFIFFVVECDFSLSMFKIISKLTLIYCISDFQYSITMLFTIQKTTLIIISIWSFQNTFSMIDSIFYASLISRPSCHMNLATLVLSYILIVVSFIGVPCTVSISSLAMFFTIWKASNIFLS